MMPVVGQVESLHDEPFAYFWQAPPWHLPFVPHEALPWSTQRPAGSAAPVVTFEQVPSVPVSEHERQEPVQASSQQTPCAQNFEPHSLAAEHEAPRPLRPHELPTQVLGVRQFASAVHAPKHDVPLQTYGLQGSESGATHWPVALHVDGGL
jgi:hypothetical protein